jgi:hypothetical protein
MKPTPIAKAPPKSLRMTQGHGSRVWSITILNVVFEVNVEDEKWDGVGGVGDDGVVFGDALNFFSRPLPEFARAMDPRLARDTDFVGPIAVNVNHTSQRPVTACRWQYHAQHVRSGTLVSLKLALLHFVSQFGGCAQTEQCRTNRSVSERDEASEAAESDMVLSIFMGEEGTHHHSSQFTAPDAEYENTISSQWLRSVVPTVAARHVTSYGSMQDLGSSQCLPARFDESWL